MAGEPLHLGRTGRRRQGGDPSADGVTGTDPTDL